MAVDIAVDDYSKSKNITTWVRVKSSKENHIRLAEYLTKGRMVLVEGTLTSSIWADRGGENHIQHSIIADSIAFVNAGKRDATFYLSVDLAFLQANSATDYSLRVTISDPSRYSLNESLCSTDVFIDTDALLGKLTE